jgi:hypothetical protein
MKVRNLRSYAVEIPEVGVAEAGHLIEVDDDLGRELVKQTDAWEKHAPKKD